MATKSNVKTEARLESQLRAKSNALKQTDKKYKALQDELEKANSALQSALQVMSYVPTIYEMKPRPTTKNGQATAFLLLSDVHCDEVIPSHKVNGLNKHTPDISKVRVANVFERFLRFVRIKKKFLDVHWYDSMLSVFENISEHINNLVVLPVVARGKEL